LNGGSFKSVTGLTFTHKFVKNERGDYLLISTDKERDLKFILMSNHLIPKLAVDDPLVCKSMPPGLTVESGIDALAHCIEGYVSLATPYHPYFQSMAL
jgi:alcohol dehydrogenase class IV